MPVSPLTKVGRDRDKLDASTTRLHDSIRAARANGLSLRVIATAASLSPERIRQICGET